jgi:cytochrome b6-f complex iron-sulfur subunit
MSNNISRRDFLIKSALGVLAGSAVLSSLDLVKLFANSKKGSFFYDENDLIIKLADEKNSGLSKVGGSVLIDDDNILIRTSETQFSAVSLICTHKGCTVELSGDKFVCPCHGSEYTISGKVTEGPAKKDLKTYETVYDPDKGTVTVKDFKSTVKDEQKSDSTKIK